VQGDESAQERRHHRDDHIEVQYFDPTADRHIDAAVERHDRAAT
jgi:hypothetical protein